jgi:hypothetical protein
MERREQRFDPTPHPDIEAIKSQLESVQKISDGEYAASMAADGQTLTFKIKKTGDTWRIDSMHCVENPGKGPALYLMTEIANLSNSLEDIRKSAEGTRLYRESINPPIEKAKAILATYGEVSNLKKEYIEGKPTGYTDIKITCTLVADGVTYDVTAVSRGSAGGTHNPHEKRWIVRWKTDRSTRRAEADTLEKAMESNSQ